MVTTNYMGLRLMVSSIICAKQSIYGPNMLSLNKKITVAVGDDGRRCGVGPAWRSAPELGRADSEVERWRAGAAGQRGAATTASSAR